MSSDLLNQSCPFSSLFSFTHILTSLSDLKTESNKDAQLEILTELRQVVSTLASAQTRLFHEASEIMNLVNMIMGSYANSGIAPEIHTLHILEARMIALHNEICSVRAEEDYYRDLEREIFAQIGQ
ncbi:hypothetical protein N7465_001194 [Penicillium sp. CMV-2018d]|nr:hypothetical protein N7465_001194 [Penicillium sp. CMV-2018d]